jgi:ABC-type sugar transport system permease subunit
MSDGRRWRLVAGGAVLLTGLASVAAARWAARGYAREGAERLAATTAAYFTLVTPAAPGSSDYDLGQLFIQAHALARVPGWSTRFEVYHGTAPLVTGQARPLPIATLLALRQRETVVWSGGEALAPLLDRDQWDVVGAVAARPVPTGWPGVLAFGALLLAILSGWRAAGRVGPGGGRPAAAWPYTTAALLLGLAAYADARQAASRGTERWLDQTRLLLMEAAQRQSGSDAAVLAPIARAGGAGAELSPGTEAGAEAGIRVERPGGAPRAVLTVRIGPGRWLTLAATPEQSATGGWFALCLGLAALGPLALRALAWGARSTTRPRRLRETVVAWGFLAPAALHLAIFSFGPILFALVLSVHRWSLVEPVKPFVGLANFVRLAGDPLVWISLRNTALFTLHVPVTMAIALCIALILNRHTRLARLARTAFFLPYVSSVVAIALVWQWIYHADFGVLNYVLSFVGVGPVDWLGSPGTALLAVMLVSVWVQVGYQMVVFLAGLQGIPATYLDAARVDGASAWQRFWRITFPLLKPVTLFVLVTGVINSFQVFTYIYVLTDGGPLHATDVMVYRIYQTAWEFLQFGYASALALLLFLLLFGATWAQFRLLGEDRRVDYA